MGAQYKNETDCPDSSVFDIDAIPPIPPIPLNRLIDMFITKNIDQLNHNIGHNDEQR